jgi:hypothetical protein
MASKSTLPTAQTWPVDLELQWIGGTLAALNDTECQTLSSILLARMTLKIIKNRCGNHQKNEITSHNMENHGRRCAIQVHQSSPWALLDSISHVNVGRTPLPSCPSGSTQGRTPRAKVL